MKLKVMNQSILREKMNMKNNTNKLRKIKTNKY